LRDPTHPSHFISRLLTPTCSVVHSHFQSSLAYVLEQGYRTQPSFQRYISARGEKLREQGYDTDIWGYDSAFPAEAQGKVID